MSVYWDSSALLNAIASQNVAVRMASGDISRSHAFCEVFSVLTGRGLPTKSGRVTFSNSDAAKIIDQLARKLSLRDLTGLETLTALRDARLLGVQGARIHDLMHARSAVLAGVDKVLTRNIDDFSGLTGQIPVERP
jgi:hypothetical protein